MDTENNQTSSALPALLKMARATGRDAFVAAAGPAFLLVRAQQSAGAADNLMVTRCEVASPTPQADGALDLNHLDGYEAYAVKRRARSRFGGDYVSIGRGDNNDIVLQSESVSKFHAFVTAKDDGFTIADAGSRNGTFLNEERVPGYRDGPGRVIADGDSLRFGDIRATFVSASAVMRLAAKLG
jgi:hypothetical protein